MVLNIFNKEAPIGIWGLFLYIAAVKKHIYPGDICAAACTESGGGHFPKYVEVHANQQLK